jgi:hypothetical protein
MSDQSNDVEDVTEEAPEAPLNEPAEPDADAGDGTAGDHEEGGAPDAPQASAPAQAPPPSPKVYKVGNKEYTDLEEAYLAAAQKAENAQRYISAGGHKRGDPPPEGIEGPPAQPLGMGIFSESTPPRSLEDFRDWFLQSPEDATLWSQRNPGSVREDFLNSLQSLWAEQDRSSYERYWEPIRKEQALAQIRQEFQGYIDPLMEDRVEALSVKAEDRMKQVLGQDLYKQIEAPLAEALRAYTQQGTPFFTREDLRDRTGEAWTRKLLWLADQVIGSQHRERLAQQAREQAKAAAEAKRQETNSDAHAKVSETRGNAGGGSTKDDEDEPVSTRAVRRVQGRPRIPG